MGLAIMLLLLAGNLTTWCQERHIAAGLEICSLARGCAGVDFEYGFSSHWSVRSTVSLRYRDFISTHTALEEEHDSDFPHVVQAAEQAADFHREQISINFWPGSPHVGLFISTGIRYGNLSGFDALMGIGYSMRIWKGLHIKAGYHTPLLQAIGGGIDASECLALSLCFTL